MSYKTIILNSLLDKYENSKAYQKVTKRRILLYTRNLKEYNIEDSEAKQEFHDVVIELKKQGLINFSWEKYEVNNILEVIWLEKNAVENAYKEIGRKNPKMCSKEVSDIVKDYKFEQEWIKDFQQEVIQQMEQEEKESVLLPKEKAREILTALKQIDNLQEETLKRVFSMQCYRDSKFFENQIEKFIIRIIRKYKLLAEYEKEYSDEEVLLEVGIAKSPEILEFYGTIQIELESGEKVKYTQSTLGSYINSYTVQHMRILQEKKIQKIIWIENKTNYNHYIKYEAKANELVIYHGGMYSPNKAEFFKKVYTAFQENPSIEFWHWGDIDLGGFQMFTRLRDHIIPTLQPYKMDISTFLEYQEYWKPIEANYKKRLEDLLNFNKYQVFYDLIKEMLKQNVKLEQESLLC